MDGDDEFGLDPVKLAAWVTTLGTPYLPYVQNISDKGLFGAFLLDIASDVDKFATTLAKVGVEEVRPKILKFHLLGIPPTLFLTIA